MASIIREVGETFGALVKGFSVTFRNMFRKTVTENYPYEPVHFQPRYRGIHVLHRDESGLESVLGAFSAPLPAPQIAFISKPPKTRMRTAFPRGALRQRLQHRLFAMHFLRVLRGSVSDGCDHAWPRF